MGPPGTLPFGCPYPYPYLPVPLDDFQSGRWLTPDYVPTLELPAPYPPWRCGGTASQGQAKWKEPPGVPEVANIQEQEVPDDSLTRIDLGDVGNLDFRLDGEGEYYAVGMPDAVGSAAGRQSRKESERQVEKVYENQDKIKALQMEADGLKTELAQPLTPEDRTNLIARLAELERQSKVLAQEGNSIRQQYFKEHPDETTAIPFLKPIQVPTLGEIVARGGGFAEPPAGQPVPVGPPPCAVKGPDGKRIKDGSDPKDGRPPVESTNHTGKEVGGSGIGGPQGHSLASLSKATKGGQKAMPSGALVGTGVVDDIESEITKNTKGRPEVVGRVYSLEKGASQRVSVGDSGPGTASWGRGAYRSDLVRGADGLKQRGTHDEGKPLTEPVWFGMSGPGDFGFIQYVAKSINYSTDKKKSTSAPMKESEGPMQVDKLSSGDSDWYKHQAGSSSDGEGAALMSDAPGVGIPGLLADRSYWSQREIEKLFTNLVDKSKPGGQLGRTGVASISASGSLDYDLSFKTLVVNLADPDCKRRIVGHWVWKVRVSYDSKGAPRKWTVNLVQPPAWLPGPPSA